MVDLVLFDLVIFATGLFAGIFGTFIACRLSAKSNRRKESNEKERELSAVIAKMPGLISEIKDDLSSSEMNGCRDFSISQSKSVVSAIKAPSFVYYEDEHKDLTGKVKLLENEGLVCGITLGDCRVYKFEEEFVKRVLK